MIFMLVITALGLKQFTERTLTFKSAREEIYTCSAVSTVGASPVGAPYIYRNKKT